MINAGKYNRKIQIVSISQGQDSDGFKVLTETILLEPYADTRTTKGYTLIANNSDFEKALTKFTIRYSPKVEKAYLENNRNLRVKFKNKTYTIEYFNNIDEANVEIELQCKVVEK